MGKDLRFGGINREGVGRFWYCSLCGEKIQKGEDFVLDSKVPTRSLLYGEFGITHELFDKGGHVYHKACYKLKDQQGKTEAAEGHSRFNVPQENEFKTF
jgi:hypothetical protein